MFIYSFNKIFHITGEIGAFVYFLKSENIPVVQIKQIKQLNNQYYWEDIFSSTRNYEFVINGNGKYSLIMDYSILMDVKLMILNL